MSAVAGLAAKSLRFASAMAKAHSVGSMNSLVVITRSGIYDPVSREYDTSAKQTLYDNFTNPGAGGIAGVASTTGASSLSLGDEPQYYSSVIVYIPQESPTKNLMINDIVQIIYCPDNDIIGRLFRVDDIPVGGRLYSSIPLHCTGIAPSREWTG